MMIQQLYNALNAFSFQTCFNVTGLPVLTGVDPGLRWRGEPQVPELRKLLIEHGDVIQAKEVPSKS